MDAIEELRSEHGQLRGWVDQLERALPVAETCLPAVSARVTTLADLLARHLQKEFLLIGLVSEPLDATGASAPARLAQAVARERERLHRLGAQLAAATPRNAAPLIEELGEVVRHLRQTWAAEESSVFPLLERAVPPAAQPDALHLFHLLSDRGGPASASPPEAPPGVPELLWQACDAMMVIDDQRRILAVNPAMERLMGHSASELVGRQQCSALFACHTDTGCSLAEQPDRCPGMRAMRRGRAIAAATYLIRTPAGRTVPVCASYTPLPSRADGTVCALAVLRDVRVLQRQERRLLRQATTDLLTGLPNRASFLRGLSEHLARARRLPAPCAVAMADLDGFKAYNDRHGHHAGDMLLAAIASQLTAGHRGADMVARFGGDEFVLCVPDADAATAMAAAERLRKVVAEAAPSDPPVTISFGVAVCPDDGQAAEALLAKADERLYAAKRRGGNRVVGPAYGSERRRHRRHDVALPVRFAAEALEEGITRDIGLGGLRCYVSAPVTEPPVVGRVIQMALSVSPELHGIFPADDLSESVRVLRVQPLGRVLAGRQRFELALALEAGAFLRAASA